MATKLSAHSYHDPFRIGDNWYAKSGVSIASDQRPPSPIGSGDRLYRCFHVDTKTMKKKPTFSWIGCDTEIETFVPLHT